MERAGSKAVIKVVCSWRCGVCQAVCAEGAVKRLVEGVSIDRSACSKCLACVVSCPAGTIGEEEFD